MLDDLLQTITIYHKEKEKYQRYNVKASVRNTAYLNRNKTGVQTTDTALIRIFDIDEYNNTWKCQKGDVIVNKNVYDNISKSPLTELKERYGKENVYEVSSVDKFIFNENEIKQLNHIKLGAR